MNLARTAKPASVAMAVAASALLLVGFVVPGLVLGVSAVGVAWLRFPPPPTPPAD